jgi:hypothetical protein
MINAERAERLRFLAASLSADEEERDRLKKRADESLARLHEAVREFVRVHDFERPAARSRPARG